MLCNRCRKEILPDQMVRPSYSGRHPYAHADAADCPPLRDEPPLVGPSTPARPLRDLEDLDANG
jgi:hypothetical protein